MSRRNREQLFLTASGVVVAAALGIAFFRMGSPSRQREFEADRVRVQDMHQVATEIYQRNIRPGEARLRPPANLADLHKTGAQHIRIVDPETLTPYDYKLINEVQYELCAVFTTSSRESLNRPQPGTSTNFWEHPPGRHCFTLDATHPPPFER